MNDRHLKLIPLALAFILVSGSIMVAHLAGIAWWIGLILGIVGILVNGWVAVWEDDRPGGFNNPRNPPDSK